MGIISKVLAKRAHKKHVKQENKAKQEDWWHITRMILPPTVSERHDHVVLSTGMFARPIVVGVPDFDRSGYSNVISSELSEDLLATAQDGCYCSCSFEIETLKNSSRAMEKAEFANLLDRADDTEMTGAVRNHTQFTTDAIREDQRKIYDQEVRQFNTSNIVTVYAPTLEELNISTSRVTSILGNNLVGYAPPEGRMLEAFLSSQPWGTMSPLSRVDAISSQVAELLPLRRPYSRTDSRGTWFGNLKTDNPNVKGKEVLVDLEALTADHGLIIGPTGSGKTFLELVLMMRMYATQQYRIIYMTVKEDAQTGYRNVPDFYGSDGAVIDVGDGAGKTVLNPLQIVYDQTMTDGTPADYLRMYHHHKAAVMAFFDAYLKNGLSDNQEAFVDRTLNEIYAKHGMISLTKSKIICHPDKWDDGDNFPTVHDLRESWQEYMSGHGRIGESAESLYNRTAGLSKTGAHSYINQATTTDLSKDFIIIDLSGLGEALQDAMSILLVHIIHARFNSSADKKTLLMIDEGVAFTRNPARAKFLADSMMMGRSRKVSTVISFTQPTDLSGELSAMLQTNTMWAFVLGKGMNLGSVEHIKKFLHLSDEDVSTLKTSERGEGLLMLGNQSIPIRLDATDLEASVIKGTYGNEIASTAIGIQIRKELVDLVESNGVCLDSWIQNPDPEVMKAHGYEPQRVQMVDRSGSAKVWVLSDMIERDGKKAKIYNQTLDHYVSVIMIAGRLITDGFSDVVVSHFDDEDVRAELGENTFSFEYERPGSHTEEQLIAKCVKLENAGKRSYFVCQQSYKAFVAKAVGESNTYQRGETLNKAIESLVSDHDTVSTEEIE